MKYVVIVLKVIFGFLSFVNKKREEKENGKASKDE